jgi:hypothetical protein
MGSKVRMSWSEIATNMARLIAAQHGCELESFSLDGIEVNDEDGVEVIHVQASATVHALSDEIPWEDDDEVLFELPIAEQATPG